MSLGKTTTWASAVGLLAGIIAAVVISRGSGAEHAPEASMTQVTLAPRLEPEHAAPTRQSSGEGAMQASSVTPAVGRSNASVPVPMSRPQPTLAANLPRQARQTSAPGMIAAATTRPAATSPPDDIPPPPPLVVIPSLAPPGETGIDNTNAASTIVSPAQFAASAVHLEQLRRKQPTNPAVLLNLAYIYVRQEEPLHAGRMLEQFLEEHKDGDPHLQETIQNAIGTCLAHVEKHNDAYQDLQRLYDRFDQKLSSNRTNGCKRWGQEWIAGYQADENWQRLRTAELNFVRAKRQAARDDAAYQKLAQEYNDFASSNNRHFGSNAAAQFQQEVVHFRMAVQRAEALRTRSATGLTSASSMYQATPKPPWPTSIPTPPLSNVVP